MGNIAPGSDSLGNLILRFNLADLLNVDGLEESLVIGGDNTFTVVVTKTDGAESTTWVGADNEVYIIEKKSR